MNTLTIVALILLGLIAGYTTLLAYQWRQEAIRYHQLNHRAAAMSLTILACVHNAAKKMDLANHKDAAAILVGELEILKDKIAAARREVE